MPSRRPNSLVNSALRQARLNDHGSVTRHRGNAINDLGRCMSVVGDRPDFAAFYRDAVDDCLRAVAVSVADADVARDLVDEAFARAWASWPTVSRHPAPKAWIVRTALNA